MMLPATTSNEPIRNPPHQFHGPNPRMPARRASLPQDARFSGRERIIMKPPRATRAQTKPANKKNIANPTLPLDVVAIGWPLRLAELLVVAGKLSTCTRAPDNKAIAPRMPMVSARVGFLSPDETQNPGLTLSPGNITLLFREIRIIQQRSEQSRNLRP